MLSEEAALEKILARIAPPPYSHISLTEARGRFTLRSVVSSCCLPRFDNSAMDGYAIRAADLPLNTPLQVVGEQPAGRDLGLSVGPGQAIRIFTGAPLPAGADTVVPQEEVRRTNSGVMILAKPMAGDFIRQRGCDLAEGQVILESGQALTSRNIALLAALGETEVEVARPPSVSIYSTGNELQPCGGKLLPGDIYDSNGPMLMDLLARMGIPTRSPRLIPDCAKRLREAWDEARRQDVTLITGGVSVGEHDLVRQSLQKAGGKVEVWRINMKPGRPFLFGTLGKTLVFGLPGNPVSVYFTFLKMVRPALLQRLGANQSARALPRISTRAAQPLHNPGQRPHYLRGRLDDKGLFETVGLQESHALFGLSQCHCSARLAPGECIGEGDSVLVELWPDQF